ncbi:MAG TPA: M3 family metallopeptidase [Candidatus Lumbricidophila sp.]|nr:M3 family metallopeptidase [Candidatus Lumbricidophila sp.]
MDASSNPFAAPSTLPYRLPEFARTSVDVYRDAITAGMHEQRAEVEAIATNAADATFENTLLALEHTGALLRRVLPVFWNEVGADTTPELDALDAELAPLLSTHHDAIQLDPRLFTRVAALYAHRETLNLDTDQAYLLERAYTDRVLAGAGLDDEARAELSEINARLSTLTTAFDQHLQADTNALALHLTDEAELDGLDDGQRAAAREAAHDRGLDGWLITLNLPTGQPALASLTRADVRDRLLAASQQRGSRGGEHDTRETLLQIARLRAERAALLGFADHASAVAAGGMAGSAAAIADLLTQLAASATLNAAREHQALSERAATVGARTPSAADWSFLTEQVRAEEHHLDLAALRPYFELHRVLVDGVFYAATLLYGITFTRRTDLVGYHADTQIYEVFEASGDPVGLYLFDPYTRDSKRGGAWMSSLVDQSDLTGDLPVVVNTMNIPRPPDGEPTLLTYDETETLFHEFGHALHGLLARVRYPSQAGTEVFRDFVELPSQVNELWMLRPEILGNYAVHHVTGERMPHDVVDRLIAARLFNQGFLTVEYLGAALLDQAWHRVSSSTEIADVSAFEASALAAAGLLNPLIPPRYSTAYFQHIFSSGYDAGYYSYIWSEVPGADIVEWFEAGGGATRESGERFRRELLGVGGSRHPSESIRAVLGREPRVDALLRSRGLA